MNYSHKNILETLKLVKDSLPAKQRQLCNYILANYKTVGMVTVADLARQANVGTTTVMRLIESLGYSTYNDLKKELFSVSILQENSSYQNIKYAFSEKESDNMQSNLTYVSSELINIARNLLTAENLKQYEEIAELLSSSKRINIFGCRSSKAAAFYAQYSLSPFLSERIYQLSDNPDFVFDEITRVSSDEVLLLICNWPCSAISLEIAQFCKDRKVPVVLITNSSANPVAKLADAMLDTDSVSSPCLLSPALMIIEALSFELARRSQPESTHRVDDLEKMLKEKNLLVW